MKRLKSILRALCLPAKVVKTLAGIAMVFGVIVTYSAYKAEAPTYAQVRSSVVEDFRGITVDRATERGKKLILLYNAVKERPQSVSLDALYGLAVKSIEEQSPDVTVKADSILRSPAIASITYQRKLQLQFVEAPIQSGSILGGSLLVVLYLAGLLVKGCWRMARPRSLRSREQQSVEELP